MYVYVSAIRPAYGYLKMCVLALKVEGDNSTAA